MKRRLHVLQPRVGLRSLTLVLLVWASLCVSPSDARADVVCKVVGTGSYVYEPTTLVDYYQLQGELQSCDGVLDPALRQGRFTAEGSVATIGLSGPGSIRIQWQGGSPSQGDFVMTGVPAALAMHGRLAQGSYAGAEVVLLTGCSVASLVPCFQLGGSSFQYVGTLVIRSRSGLQLL